ncbi:TPA: hypothetical protein JK846_003578 [Escherichia coli]|nr:hypothetical protein [Salmonella enterica]EJF7575662.1 hypothetical protein [Salmonella enterica subsp. enterica]HAV7961464.1 hypothetical protein [Escherichia coli]
MAILVESGRAAVATAIMNQPIHLAWGEGDPSWDVTKPTENTSTTSLVKELGRLKAVDAYSVVPNNNNGSIVVSGGKFDKSPNNAATKYLYLRFQFDFMDAQYASIRELGIYVGTQVSASVANPNAYLPDGAGNYSGGQLLVLEYLDKLVRSSQIRQQFEFVIQF